MTDSRISATVVLLTALLLLGQPSLFAQDAADPTKNTTAAGDPAKRNSGPPVTARVEVVFQDGSTVRMEAAAMSMIVATKYGRLTVPLHEVRRIRLRPRLSDEMKRQIAVTIAALGSTTFAEREAAVPKLKAMGVRSLPQLRKASKNPNAEIRRRAAKLVEEMEKMNSPAAAAERASSSRAPWSGESELGANNSSSASAIRPSPTKPAGFTCGSFPAPSTRPAPGSTRSKSTSPSPTAKRRKRASPPRA